MNKNDLIEKVARVTCAKQEAADAVNETLVAIKQALRENKRVTLSGLGSFSIKQRKARKGHNPRTGKTIQIKERTVVKFIPAKNLLAEEE